MFSRWKGLLYNWRLRVPIAFDVVSPAAALAEGAVTCILAKVIQILPGCKLYGVAKRKSTKAVVVDVRWI